MSQFSVDRHHFKGLKGHIQVTQTAIHSAEAYSLFVWTGWVVYSGRIKGFAGKDVVNGGGGVKHVGGPQMYEQNVTLRYSGTCQ